MAAAARRRFDAVVVDALAEAARTLCAEHDRQLAELHAAAAATAANAAASSKSGAAEEEKAGGGAQSRTLPPLLQTPSAGEEEEGGQQDEGGAPLQLCPGYSADDPTAGLAGEGGASVGTFSSLQAEAVGRKTLSPWLASMSDLEDEEGEHGRGSLERRGPSGTRSMRSTRSAGTGGRPKKASMTISKAMTLDEVLHFGAMGRSLERRIPFLQRVIHDRSLQNSLIEAFIATIVLLNLAVIGISSDVATAWRGWIFVNAVFAFLFSMESCMKVYLVGAHEFACGPERLWNIFEACLALLAVLEVALAMYSASTESHLSLLRVVRLARLARVIRICRLEAFSELMMMINGAVGGIKTLLWSIVLISIPLYAVALLMRETLGETKFGQLGGEEEVFDSAPRNLTEFPAVDAAGALCRDTRSAAQAAAAAFQTLPWSFFSVFRCVVGQDCSSEDGKPIFLLVTKAYGWGYGVVYCITMLLMTFGLFNVIVAIYVENTVAAAKVQEMTAKQSRLNNYQLVAEKLHELVEITCEIWGRKFAATLEDSGNVPEPVSIPGSRSSGAVHARATRGESILTVASNLEITPKFLDFLKEDPRVLEILRDLDIADADIRVLFETLDVDGGGTIDTEEMIRGLTQLRGDASRSDIVGVKLVVRNLQVQLSALQQVCQELADLQKGQLQELELLKPAAQRREQLRDAIARSSADGETLRI